MPNAKKNTITLKGSILQRVGAADNAEQSMDVDFPMHAKTTKGGKDNAESGRVNVVGPNGTPFYFSVYAGRSNSITGDEL